MIEKNDDLISIIVPIYNTSKYLERCIKSIINQTYTNVEILLIDDGSTDNSYEICHQYSKSYENIKAFHKRNEGLSSTRNFGIYKAKGKYISFIDSDDFVASNFLEELYWNLIKEDSDISVCSIYKFTKENKINKKSIVTKTLKNFNRYNAMKELIKFNGKLTNHAVNKLYKKELFKEVNFLVGKKFEDIDFMYKILNESKKISTFDDKLYYYYIRNNSITGNLKKNDIYDKIDIILKRDEFIKENYNNLLDSCNEYLVHSFIVIFKQLVKLEGKNIIKDTKYNYLKEKIIIKDSISLNLKEKILLKIANSNNSNIYEFIYKILKIRRKK